jgi:[acyl-carrier-protein] S-malonyltransferase/trans-AT polyketide synthase/acyltransferase/oxidoreductase domain-containing protein
MTVREQSSAVAVVFPGQGAQRPGIGRDFHAQFRVSRDAFVEASDALGIDVARICFDDDPRIDETEFTQPCIVATEIAMYRALEVELGLGAVYFGGHSLGEYAALCAAGVMSLADAMRVTRRRGALMQVAVPKGEGAMLAVIANGICNRDLAAVLSSLDVDVANRNSPDQVVISGAAAAVLDATALLERMLDGTEHRLVPLNVSAPFHSRLMRTIEPEFASMLASVSAAMRPDGARACTSNVTGAFHNPATASVVDLLTRQISSPVDWIANMNAIGEVAGRIYEVGPGKPLTGFFKSIGRVAAPILSVKHAQRALGAAHPLPDVGVRSASNHPQIEIGQTSRVVAI